MNIHGAHSYWKQGALGDTGVGRVYGLELSRGVQGRGHIVRPRAQLVRLVSDIETLIRVTILRSTSPSMIIISLRLFQYIF